MAPARILLVDDDEVDRLACRRALLRGGSGMFEFVEVNSAAQAIDYASSEQFDCLLLDFRLPDMDGIELMDRLLERPADTPVPVVMLTGADDVSVAVEAMRRGASDYLVKDVEGRYQALIPAVVQRVMRDHEMRRAKSRAEQALQVVVSSASDAIISADGDGCITLFNPSAEQIFGCDAASAMGLPLGRFFDPVSGRVTGRRSDGQHLDLEVSLSRATVQGRTMMTAIVREVTQRVQAELALARYRQQLSRLTQQLMAQEKTTTRRIAQSLHDQLGQTLAAMRLSFDVVQSVQSAPPDSAPRRHAERVSALIDQAVREVRQVLVDLRPPLLDEQGLAAALDNELRSRAPAHEEIELLLEAEVDCAQRRWPTDVEYAVFMIAREALANALRHADATTVRVQLCGSNQALELHVVDDGSGIEDVALASRPGHLGMVGMRERALAIGAHCAVSRNDSGGTTVSLHWEMN
ncbi:MAG TPA: response regulator [Albitalea sp.]|nr:response regulator [Albitalea sp.]